MTGNVWVEAENLDFPWSCLCWDRFHYSSCMWTIRLPLSQWFSRPLLTQFLVFWLHNYRIIASLYQTQWGALNQGNHEITAWDGMICWSQRYYRLWPGGRERERGRGSVCTLHQSTACSCVCTETLTKAPTHIWRSVATDTRKGCLSQKIELN